MNPPSTQSLEDVRAAAAKIPPATDAPVFFKEKHIAYWLRCLRSPLPHQYTANDSNRLTLAFFILSALDLLGVLLTRTTIDERDHQKDWIYGCQHPDGGFRAFPGTNFGDKRTEENKAWDPANLPGTYFALASLVILGDDLASVKRRECLQWLRKLQRNDGSFGQTLGLGESIEGGMDPRFGYCATGVRWILRGSLRGSVDGVPDVDCEALARCIRNSETYDGGISEASFHEGHAGFTYCAIGALSFIGRSQEPPEEYGASSSHEITLQEKFGLSDPQNTIRWLVSRLTTTTELDECDDEDRDDTVTISSTSTIEGYADETAQNLSNSFSNNTEIRSVVQKHAISTEDLSQASKNAQKAFLSPQALFASETVTRSAFSRDEDLGEICSHLHVHSAGFNGRVNKVADTCYAFWVGGSLCMLDSLQLADPTPVRRFLLEKTQNKIMGGFGKCAGDLPDIFHSYLGLAALALLGIEDGLRNDAMAEKTYTGTQSRMGSPGVADGEEDGHASRPEASLLGALDPTLCISVRARQFIQKLVMRDRV